MVNRMVFPMPELAPVLTSFGWNAHKVDATDYSGVYTAREQFQFGPSNGKTYGNRPSWQQSVAHFGIP